MYDYIKYNKDYVRYTTKHTSSIQWVYNALNQYGNVMVSLKTYDKLNKKRLGKHTKKLLKPNKEWQKSVYILWRD